MMENVAAHLIVWKLKSEPDNCVQQNELMTLHSC